MASQIPGDAREADVDHSTRGGLVDILPQLLVNSLIAGSIYALASAGLSLTYGVLRILNFAHGHLMMAGAYAFYYAHVEKGLGVFPAAVVAALCTIILAALSYLIFILPFVRFSSYLPLITTLSLSTLIESAVSILFGVNVKSLSTNLESSYEIYGTYITPTQIIIVTSAVSILVVLAWVVHKTSWGRKIRALAEHGSAAQAVGISSRANGIVFVVGALLAAYAGVMVGFETNLQPTMGNSYTIKAFAAMILGGLGNIWGTIAGAFILGLVENFSIGLDFWGYSVPAGYKDAFAFLVILGVLLFKPSGLFGTRTRVA